MPLERDNGTSITDKALIAGRLVRRLRPSAALFLVVILSPPSGASLAPECCLRRAKNPSSAFASTLSSRVRQRRTRDLLLPLMWRHALISPPEDLQRGT
jgi:hypothetical protein